MIRTTPDLVAGIIELDPSIVLDPFISAASQLVDEIAPKTHHSDERLQTIETWLAAHFYCMRDPRTSMESAGSVKATYQSWVRPNLQLSHYGQMAIVLDTSSLLARMSRGALPVSVNWLGTPTPLDKELIQ